MTTAADGSPAVEVISFGYLHGPPPAAGVTADLREHFRDPHADPALRQLTADDPRVAAAVLATPGIPALASALAAAARAFLVGGLPVTVAVGCAGGRHRSPAVASLVAAELRAGGVAAIVRHRDITQPVVRRSGTRHGS